VLVPLLVPSGGQEEDWGHSHLSWDSREWRIGITHRHPRGIAHRSNWEAADLPSVWLASATVRTPVRTPLMCSFSSAHRVAPNSLEVSSLVAWFASAVNGAAASGIGAAVSGRGKEGDMREPSDPIWTTVI
jgi:hypothetical protein